MPAKHKGLQRTVARDHKSALCKSVVEIVPPNGSGVGRALLTILNYVLYFVALKNDFYNWCAPWKFLTLATVRRKLFYFVGTFLKYPIFLFYFFSYKDQNLCQHAVWHDFSHAKTRFEGLKLLDFSLMKVMWQVTNTTKD